MRAAPASTSVPTGRTPGTTGARPSGQSTHLPSGYLRRLISFDSLSNDSSPRVGRKKPDKTWDSSSHQTQGRGYASKHLTLRASWEDKRRSLCIPSFITSISTTRVRRVMTSHFYIAFTECHVRLSARRDKMTRANSCNSSCFRLSERTTELHGGLHHFLQNVSLLPRGLARS